MVKFLIIRHGYSITNKAKKFTGQMDAPLDDIGFEQAKSVGKYISENYKIDKIYSKDLIYNDVIPFLEKYYQKYELILLTLGNKIYQKKKIDSTNINKYFKDIIITDKDKSKLNINYKEGLFIDNNPNELKKFYNSKALYLIRIKRDTDKYSKYDINIKDIQEFKDFNEISTYIEKIGENNYE